MSKFPVIESPCPLRASTMPQAGKDHCGHCDRQVHNLDGMSRSQREAFMRSCAGQKVCVAYTVQRKADRRNVGLGITLLASLTGSGLAAAQEIPTALRTQNASGTDDSIEVSSVTSTTILTSEQIARIPVARNITSVGGILDAGQARWVDEDQIEPSTLDTLPDIGELEWLPTKQP